MANLVGNIAIQVGADISPLVRDLSKARGEVSSFGRQVAQGGLSMSTLAKGAGIAAASALAAGAAMAAFTKGAMDNIDALSKQARVAGVSVAKFQAMALVAEEAGLSSEGLSKAMVKLSVNIGNLGQGTQTQVDAFARLGISFEQIANLKPEEQFALVAQAIDGITDPAQKVSAAVDIFGKSGADAINMLGGFSEAVQNAEKYQRQFGLAVSDLDAQNIEAANDAMGRVTTAVGGLATELAVRFAPAVEIVAVGLTALINDLLGTKTAMEQTFETAAIAKAILGEDLYNALKDNDQAFANNAQRIGEYQGVLQSLSGWVQDTAYNFFALSQNLKLAGETGASQEILAVGSALIEANRQFDNGEISAEAYRAKIEEARAKAVELMDSVKGVDGIDLSGARGQVAGLFSILKAAAEKALALRAALPSTAAPESDGRGSQREAYASSTLAPKTSPRPRAAIVSVDFGDTGSGSGSGGRGIGGGDNGEAAVKQMQARFATEQEQQQAQYEESLRKLEEFRQNKLLTEQQYNDLEAKVKADHEKALTDLQTRANSEKLSAISGAFGDLSSLMQSGNAKLFRVGQAAAVAEAVVSGYQAAVDAWQKGMKIGGPPVAAAFTAASLVKTAGLIAKIKSASPSGSGGGGGGGGGSSAAAPAQAAEPSGTYLNFQFNGGWTSTEDMGRFMVKAINQAVENGAQIRGARIV